MFVLLYVFFNFKKKNVTDVDRKINLCAPYLLSLFCQHIEDNSEIQEFTKYKPHVLLTQENTQIKDLQRENKGKIELEIKLNLHTVSVP